MNTGIWGLSPRTRGKLHLRVKSPGGSGPIPANAGETGQSVARVKKKRAYPRERGGNFGQVIDFRHSWGLSPRTRGKRVEDCLAWLGVGPIPANAGETTRLARCITKTRAYPRERGGNSCRQLTDLQKKNSKVIQIFKEHFTTPVSPAKGRRPPQVPWKARPGS